MLVYRRKLPCLLSSSSLCAVFSPLLLLLVVVINFGGSCQQQQQQQPFSPVAGSATATAAFSSLCDTAIDYSDYSVNSLSTNDPPLLLLVSGDQCRSQNSLDQQQQQQQQLPGRKDLTMAPPAQKPVIFIIGGPGSGEYLFLPSFNHVSHDALFSGHFSGKGTICDRLKAK